MTFWSRHITHQLAEYCDGRLNASEFDMAWGLYVGALR